MSFRERVRALKSVLNPRVSIGSDNFDFDDWVDDEPIVDIPDMVFDFDLALQSAAVSALKGACPILKCGG